VINEATYGQSLPMHAPVRGSWQCEAQPASSWAELPTNLAGLQTTLLHVPLRKSSNISMCQNVLCMTLLRLVATPNVAINPRIITDITDSLSILHMGLLCMMPARFSQPMRDICLY
jgi:hypothetical protein